MKKLVLFIVIALTLASVIVEAQRAKQKAPRPNVEGAVIKGNRATAKPGYEFFKQSDSEVGLRKKKNPKTPKEPRDPKIQTATFRCSCEKGGGGCSVFSNGESVFCDNAGCTQCGLTVTMDSTPAVGTIK